MADLEIWKMEGIGHDPAGKSAYLAEQIVAWLLDHPKAEGSLSPAD